MLRRFIPIFFIPFLFTACYYDKADKLYPDQAACDTAGMTYTAKIQPILKTNCLDKGCHTASNPNGAVNLESYTEVKKTVPGSKLLNTLKYIAGGSKNMPPTGKLSDCDVLKVEAWINRGTPEN
jgi:hypothetical protein